MCNMSTMFSRRCCLLLVMVSALFYQGVESASLQILPSTNVQPGSTALTLRCTAAMDLGITKLYSVHIKQRLNSNPHKIMGHIDAGGSATLDQGFTQPKYMITGSLTSVSQVSGSYLQIVITDPDCGEQAEYQCKTIAGKSDGIISPNPQQNRNVTVKTNPANLVMSVIPVKTTYDESDSITIRCSGKVGNPRKAWGWQWRRYPSTTIWSRYPDNNDIEDGQLLPPSGSECSYSQDTTLGYTVDREDDGLQIRCILDNMHEYSNTTSIYLRHNPINCSGQVTVNIILICLISIGVIFGTNQ